MDILDRKLDALFEHRGKPDPKLARERREAALRGKQRAKNAEARRREQLLNKSKNSKNVETSDNMNRQNVKQQNQQQKQQNQQQDAVQRQKVQQKIDRQSLQANKEYQENVEKFVSSAPTSNAKKVAKNVGNDVEKETNIILSAWAKLTPNEKKRRKKKMKEELQEKFDKIKEKNSDNLDSQQEREWLNKSMKNITKTPLKTADNVADLMGYKAVYTDVANVSKFMLGR